MKVEGIDHIHIYVKDLEAATKLLSNILGSHFVGPMEFQTVRTAFDDMGFEVIQPKTPDDPRAKFIEEHGEGIGAIGLKVPNVDEAAAELEAKGVKIIRRRGGPDRDVQIILTDPKSAFGVQIELVEYQNTRGVLWANLNKVRGLPWM